MIAETFYPQVRYLWQPKVWWGARSFATQKEAQDFLDWLRVTRGEEIAETRIGSSKSNYPTHRHAWINGVGVVPRNQAWRYKINHALSPK